MIASEEYFSVVLCPLDHSVLVCGTENLVSRYFEATHECVSSAVLLSLDRL